MPKVYERNCDYCGKYYRGYGVNFCSKECARLVSMNRVKLRCKFCEEEFERPVSVLKHDNPGYCSQDCWMKDVRENKALQRIQRLEMACAECGKIFEVSKTQLPRKKYCSKQCLGKANAKRVKEWHENMSPEERIAWLQKFNGPNSPHWKGGNSKIHPYRGRDWKENRRRARERDNYICQVCGITEEELKRELDVHHIHQDGGNELDNLISLCRSCHDKVEPRKGREVT